MKVQIIFKLLSIVGKHWVLIVWKISTHLVNEWISSGESDLWHFTKILSKNLFSKQYLQTSGSTWRSRKMWKSTSCMNTWKIHLYHSRRWVKTSWFMEESVLLMFSSRSFIVSSLIFRSLIYCEFIFVCGVREFSNFILLYKAVQFSKYYLLKRLSFLHCTFFAFFVIN